jgi:hypothetical protein
LSRVRAAAVIAASVGLAGCGSTAHFADKSRPATPVSLSIYVNDRQVSVAPASVGAGPVVFVVSNGAARTELVTIRPATGGGSAASTGPINPGTSAQVQVDLSAGSYTVSTSSAGGGAGGRAIKPATLHIGRARPSSNNAVMQP